MMRKLLCGLTMLAALLLAPLANAQQLPMGVVLKCWNGTAYLNCDSSVPQAVASTPYPAGATPVTASATGTTAATAATLTAAAGKTNYICGFSIRANATAAVTGNATIAGAISGTLNFTQFIPANTAGVGVTEPALGGCIAASAANTAIAVTSSAPGAGGVVSVTVWGYRL